MLLVILGGFLVSHFAWVMLGMWGGYVREVAAWSQCGGELCACPVTGGAVGVGSGKSEAFCPLCELAGSEKGEGVCGCGVETRLEWSDVGELEQRLAMMLFGVLGVVRVGEGTGLDWIDRWEVCGVGMGMERSGYVGPLFEVESPPPRVVVVRCA